ncbi:hypothetical protein [Actinoplanes utahensis]|uniref:Uncharacterized protein n=1 Tax=Actinoplanes utahensis TaxID=1869 RepID=A0A0A6UQB3_ACTUT|nr:hypothetical protein [Actinoplanes utahensis]KHD77228.1 hypothetical protein MB27_12390 [Actinoplanes utahensis]GIF33543.1 hypothetical protein Aut01nite_65290 [Actinoplanes utahensis]
MNLEFLRPPPSTPGPRVSVYLDATLLADDPSSTDMLWIALDDPSLVALDDHVRREAGVTDPRKVRADAATAAG